MTDPTGRPALYPLRCREILRDYCFDDRWIAEAFAKEGLPQHHRIAETWEVCDRPAESSAVINGPLQGQSLHELIGGYGERFYVLSQIDGSSTLEHRGERDQLRLGMSCLLPAELGQVVIEPGGKASLLMAYVPDLRQDIVGPLRAGGIADSAIVALGRHT